MPTRISAPFAIVNRGASLRAGRRSASLADVSKRAAKPTPEDKIAAARLKAAWLRVREERGLAQADAAHALGISQPAVSQYLEGKIPLGFDMLMRFSSYLGIDPNTIRQDLREQKHMPNALSSLQIHGDIVALKMAVNSLVHAMVSTIPGSAGPFVAHLERQAEAAKFWSDAGVIASVLNIAQPGHHIAATERRSRKPRGSGE